MVGQVADIHITDSCGTLIEDDKLFENVYSVATDEYAEAGHLAHIAALLGPPPKDLLIRGKTTQLFYENLEVCKNMICFASCH